MASVDKLNEIELELANASVSRRVSVQLHRHNHHHALINLLIKNGHLRATVRSHSRAIRDPLLTTRVPTSERGFEKKVRQSHSSGSRVPSLVRYSFLYGADGLGEDYPCCCSYFGVRVHRSNNHFYTNTQCDLILFMK